MTGATGAAVEGSRLPVQTSEIHWLAGLLEGEGYFGIDHANTCVVVEMTDGDVIERARAITKATAAIYRSTTRAGKPSYRLTLNGGLAAAWMMTLYPLMGARRQARIRQTLAQWRERPVINARKTTCKRGHPFDAANRAAYTARKREARA